MSWGCMEYRSSWYCLIEKKVFSVKDMIGYVKQILKVVNGPFVPSLDYIAQNCCIVKSRIIVETSESARIQNRL